MKLPKFLTPTDRKAPKDDTLILPPSILMAIAHNGGETDRKRVESLFVQDYRQQRFGFYLIMKAAADDDALQKQLLHDVANRSYDFRRLDPSFAAPGLEHLARSSKPTVEANKLAEVSRYGIGTWLQRYDHTLRTHAANKEVFMLAHATLIGFDVLAKHTLLAGQPLTILKPGRFDTPDLPTGFRLEATGVPGAALRITDLPSDFTRPDNALVFDDIRHTGAAIEATRKFWGDGSPEPDFATVVSVPGHAA